LVDTDRIRGEITADGGDWITRLNQKAGFPLKNDRICKVSGNHHFITYDAKMSGLINQTMW